MARQIVYRGRKIQVAIDTDVHKNGQSFQRDVILHPDLDELHWNASPASIPVTPAAPRGGGC